MVPMAVRAETHIVLVLLTLILAVGCGGSADEPESKAAVSDPVPAEPAGFERFTEMQPTLGDTLVPPRIGFRWVFRDRGSATPAEDPEEQETIRDDVWFRVQVVDEIGAIHADHSTRDRSLLVTLPPSSVSGSYEWWLEAYSGADSSLVAESKRSQFQLKN